LGQKTHPTGIRLGIVKDWNSRWFAGREFPKLLQEDLMLRRYVKSRLQRASVALVEIERAPKRVTITINTARPGIVIGRKGTEVDKLRDELKHLTGKEIKRPELNAQLVADNIARQLESRVSFRRAMKKSVASAVRMGAEGIKIVCSGRLGGAEMSRVEKSEPAGRVPLHTLRADIEYAQATAFTTSGAVGVKVWICHGEKMGKEAVNPQQN
jgi:small subunit ribosomal protein S3